MVVEAIRSALVFSWTFFAEVEPWISARFSDFCLSHALVLNDMEGTMASWIRSASALAEVLTPLKFIAVNAHMSNISDLYGFPLDQQRYVLCLFLAYPLAILYRQLSSATLKHWFSIVVGVSMAQFVLGNQWIHSFITAAITYLLVLAKPPGRLLPAVVFLFNMGYLSVSHWYRLYVDYMGWTLDFTGPQMLLVIKLTSFAFNYYDGMHHRDPIASTTTTTTTTTSSKKNQRVNELRANLALHRMPSLVEYFGYVYCFSTFLAGPTFEIRPYLDVTNERIDEEKKKSSEATLRDASKASALPALPAFACKAIHKAQLWASLSKLVVGVSCLLLYTSTKNMFPLSNLYNSQVASMPFLQRMAVIWISLLICRTKYYFAWKVAEGATVLAGFGCQGLRSHVVAEDKNSRKHEALMKKNEWNAVSNMDILGFELAQSVREGSRAWNKGTQAWLERYVYSRTNDSLLATYFCSAFWHGFYPGYYLFFLSLPLATAVNRLAHKKLRPWMLEADGSFGKKKKMYDVISMVSTSLAMNYLVMPFLSLSWEHSKQSWGNMRGVGHIVLVVVYLVLSWLIPTREMAHQDDEGSRKKRL